MIHSRKQYFSSFLIALLVILLIAGCEVVKNIESGFGINPSTPSETSTPTIEPLLIPTGTLPVKRSELTLTLWVPPQFDPVEGNPPGILLLHRVEAFENENPGLKVEIRVKSLTGNGSLLSSLATTTAAAPQALPGLILLNRSDFENAALKGLIFPIASRTAEYNTPDWYPFVNDLASFQGVQYGLPIFADPMVMAYRTQLISFPPKTWQEISTQDNVVVANLNNPKAVIPLAVYLTSGGKLVNDDGKAILEPDPLTRTYQFFFNASNSNAFPSWLIDLKTDEEVWNAFSQDQGVLALVWASQVLQKPLDNTSITTIPGSPSESIGFVDGWLLCVTNPTAEHSKFDLQLADYLLEPDFLAQWTEASGYLPAQRSVLAKWTDQTLVEKLSSIADHSIVSPSNEIQQQLSPILDQYVISLVRRQISPMQAVTETLSKLEGK